MATMKSSGDLLSSISADLADNNAGLISAEDVRHNMEDIAFSINRIIASGDTDIKYPFYNDVRVKHTVGVGGGIVYAESGVLFPNAPINDGLLQKEPFPGVTGIDHNQLNNLTVGDPHTQYLPINGIDAGTPRAVMTGNLAIGEDQWINASGHNNVGIRFETKPDDENGDLVQDIKVSGDFVFHDNSRVDTGHSVAKAWLNFDASGTSPLNTPVVNSYYNVSGVERIAQGKFVITFNSGTFMDNNYVAIGTSNSTTSADSDEDFDVNTVGIVRRLGDDGTSLRTCTFVIRNDAGEYVDGEINDLVCFGLGPGTTSGNTPIVIGI